MAKEYEVTKHVKGIYSVHVQADSEDEARRIADEMCGEADFGELQDIDWDDGRVSPA